MRESIRIGGATGSSESHMQAMKPYPFLIVALTGLAMAGCSSSPYEPVNQTAPIRAMDNFFRSLPPRSGPPEAYDHEHEPGYAPAYPPYQP
jgi:hypothetical protein